MLSKRYKNWKSTLDLKTCKECRARHGQIFKIDELIFPEPPLHFNCRCMIERMKARLAGSATSLQNNGADWWLKHEGELPEYYITIEEAENVGYESYLGNLHIVAPGRMIFNGIYNNQNGHLPSEPDRVWYEADINYLYGYRGKERILFSSDGLIFVTYDHYKTFEEII